MQKTLENLSSVTLFFFAALGGIQLSSTFLLVEGVKNSTISLLFHSLDLPFLLVAMVYGSARLSLAMEEAAEKGKATLTLCSVAAAFVLIVALYLNFAFPDAQLF